MADEDKTLTGEQSNTEEDKSTSTEAAKTEPKMFDEKHVKELREENKTRRKENETLRKELDDLKATIKLAADEKLTKNQEWETLAKQREQDLKDQQAKHASDLLNLTKENVAARYASRLPQPDGETDPVAEFASRLHGNTAEEIKADAERLIALFAPKPTETQQQTLAQTQANGQQARRQTTAVAPDGQPTGETDDQRRARLYKQGAINSPLFNPRTS